MKRQLILLGILCTGMVQAQTLERTVLSTNGGYATNGDLSLEWTMGELASSTLSNGNLMITEGFQQGGDIFIGVETVAHGLGLNIYPNPTSDIVHLSWTGPIEKDLTMIILDAAGKQVLNGVLTTSTLKEHIIDMNGFSKGTYHLMLNDLLGKIALSRKIIKIE